MRWAGLYLRFGMKQLKVERDPNRHSYTDTAMTPVTDHDEAELELFKSSDAVVWLDEQKRIERAQLGLRQEAS